MNIPLYITIFSGVIFIYYGINCLVSEFLRLEFIRFGLANKRKLTGALQVLGGISLLVGLYASNHLAFAASTGLALLMFLGFVVRIRIKDGFVASAPSLLLGLLNLYLAWYYFGNLGL